MVVVLRKLEIVWVHQQPCLTSVEGGEHPADRWDTDLTLVEHGFLFKHKSIVGDGSVHVAVGVVVQSDHVAFGEKMEKDGREEGKEAHATAKGHLNSQALDRKCSFEEDRRHEAEGG